MSLIRVRRDRKKNWIDARKGKPPGWLLMLFLLVVLLIWYLGRQF